MHAAFRRCLIDLDVAGAKAIWREVAPHLPQPDTDAGTLAAMHVARTAMQTIGPRLRFYSHRWLLDHGYPSQLPDRLKPSAERMYPRIEGVVGIAVKSSHPQVRDAINGAMSNAVLECYGDGHRDPLIVKPRMHEARNRERLGLGLKPRGLS